MGRSPNVGDKVRLASPGLGNGPSEGTIVGLGEDRVGRFSFNPDSLPPWLVDTEDGVRHEIPYLALPNRYVFVDTGEEIDVRMPRG